MLAAIATVRAHAHLLLSGEQLLWMFKAAKCSGMEN